MNAFSPSVLFRHKIPLFQISRAVVMLTLLGVCAFSARAAVAPSLGDCGDTSGVELISAVQGDLSSMSDDVSPLSGQQVVVEAIVTLDAQPAPLANGDHSDRYNGFWIQEEMSDHHAKGSDFAPYHGLAHICP